jgi:hypothetical protein
MLKFISMIALTFAFTTTVYAQTNTTAADETQEAEYIEWTFE